KEYDGDGAAPSASITVSPFEGIQAYASYAGGLRLPSLMETSNAYNMYISPNLRPERARNVELGINVMEDSAFLDDDALRMKFSYFNNTIDDYLSRTLDLSLPALVIYNIDKAHFSGL